jgi:hypothetical protein
MVLVQSVIRRLPNSLYTTRKNPWQDIWCKGSLLKVREEKKGSILGPRWNLRKNVSAFQVL